MAINITSHNNVGIEVHDTAGHCWKKIQNEKAGKVCLVGKVEQNVNETEYKSR